MTAGGKRGPYPKQDALGQAPRGPRVPEDRPRPPKLKARTVGYPPQSATGLSRLVPASRERLHRSLSRGRKAVHRVTAVTEGKIDRPYPGRAMVSESAEQRVQSSSHGLQYGQDWRYRYFSNDVNLTARIRYRRSLFSVLVFEPPKPRPADCRRAPDAVAESVKHADHGPTVSPAPVNAPRPSKREVENLGRGQHDVAGREEGSPHLDLYPAAAGVRRERPETQVRVNRPPLRGRARKLEQARVHRSCLITRTSSLLRGSRTTRDTRDNRSRWDGRWRCTSRTCRRARRPSTR